MRWACRLRSTRPSPPGGSSEITQYYWDMGDGTPPISNNAVPPHTYGAEGRYIVTLTVTDANNLSSEA
ncbi:MAG: PKD domain-containing protein [Caldilineaceae bacterium]